MRSVSTAMSTDQRVGTAGQVCRVLPEAPYGSLHAYRRSGGGDGLKAARMVPPEVVIDEIAASGLRGRGGAGFPTGEKWRTVRANASEVLRTSVVVNAAEGEPGTYKDRALLLANPYAVLEGALIAAHAMDATTVVIAIKARFLDQIARLHSAIDEITEAGWCEGIDVRIVEGPAEYLFGEETGLLEVLDGRPPFPRIAPPYRRGVTEVVRSEADPDPGSGLAANVQMATINDASVAPPVLVNNVETMANIPAILALGSAWFRSVGTPDSPGTIVCTVTGAVTRAAVGEVAMGTSLRDIIEHVGGGLIEGRRVKAVLVGVSGAVLTADQLDVTVSHESMGALGSGVGSAGFIVIGDDENVVGVASGVAHFLSIESCGQCTPCKSDGLAIASLLSTAARGAAEPHGLELLTDLLGSVANEARCGLARQQQTVVGSLLAHFEEDIRASFQVGSVATETPLIAEVLNIDNGTASLDVTFADKQPDWSYEQTDSGKTPVERLAGHQDSDQA